MPIKSMVRFLSGCALTARLFVRRRGLCLAAVDLGKVHRVMQGFMLSQATCIGAGNLVPYVGNYTSGGLRLVGTCFLPPPLAQNCYFPRHSHE